MFAGSIAADLRDLFDDATAPTANDEDVRAEVGHLFFEPEVPHGANVYGPALVRAATEIPADERSAIEAAHVAAAAFKIREGGLVVVPRPRWMRHHKVKRVSVNPSACACGEAPGPSCDGCAAHHPATTPEV